MASERLTPIVALGPFAGIDATTSPLYIPPGMGAFALNVDTSRYPQGFTTAKGRQNVTQLVAPGSPPYIITALNQFVFQSETDQQVVLAALSNGSSKEVASYDFSTGATSIISGASWYTQGMQFGQAFFTNVGQQYRYNSGTVSAFAWQYPAPGNTAPDSFTLGQTAPGANNIPPGTYYYTWTQITTFPDGTTQETSPNNASAFNLSLSITVGAGGAQSIDLTPTTAWSGTNADGSTWVTNIYRQSTNQPVWLSAYRLTGSAVLHDTNPDANFLPNAQLTLHNDPPPVSTSNLGVVFSHKDRAWTWVVVQNATSNNLVQSQLWFSSYGVPWSFNNSQGVILVGNEFPFDLPNNSTGVYDRNVGDIPVAGVSLSSIAVLHSRRATYVLYGDDPTTFVVRKMSDKGCIAPLSPAVCKNVEARLTDEGVYLFDGQSDVYISEPIRQLLDLYSPTNKAQAQGWYANRAYYLSLPSSGGSTVLSPATAAPATFVYYFPTQQWYILPYATSAAYAVPSESSWVGAQQYQEIVAARWNTAAGTGSLYIDSWQVGDSDLALPVTATWTGPVTDSGLPGTIKTYTHVVVNAPIQQGVTATVTLTLDPGSSPSKVYAWNFDLGLGPTLIAEVPTYGAGNLGVLASLTVSVTNTLNPAPAPAMLYSVQCFGTMAYNLIPSNVGVS